MKSLLSFIVGLGIQRCLWYRLQRISSDFEPAESLFQRWKINLLLWTLLLLLFVILPTVNPVGQKFLLRYIATQKLWQNWWRGIFVQIGQFISHHYHFFQSLSRYIWGYFCPNGIEQHRRIHEDKSTHLKSYTYTASLGNTFEHFL